MHFSLNLNFFFKIKKQKELGNLFHPFIIDDAYPVLLKSPRNGNPNFYIQHSTQYKYM